VVVGCNTGHNRGVTERFVVVGAGTMGVGIAYVACGAGFRTEIVEIDADRRAAAVEAIGARFRGAVSRGRIDDAAAEEAIGLMSAVGVLDDVAAGPEVVVEAVPERLDLKRDVLAAAEALGPGLLGTNTSSIPIRELATGLAHPERLVGLHFFNPVWAMALLEVVVGPATAGETTAAAVTLAGRLGKDPVVVRDLPGFATSRLGIALGLEAIRMVEDGVASPADIDKAMVLGYRHPMGPLELTDVVGLDVRLDIARGLRAAYGERYAPPALLERMVAEGKLGKKSGEGFYTWVDGQRRD
jgi:3-hydroxybutyryl-CoA dehydrogenase